MAKRTAFWVIVAGAVPTAFRAKTAEELLPTLRQLQRTQSDITMKWFELGRFWDSPEAAVKATNERRRRERERDAGWRPGGAHADPRARFKITRDEKRARFKRRLARGPANEGEQRPPPRRGDRPSSQPPSGPRGDRKWPDRGVRPKAPRPAGSHGRPEPPFRGQRNSGGTRPDGDGRGVPPKRGRRQGFGGGDGRSRGKSSGRGPKGRK
jgi:hypothetical protein